MAAVTHGTRRDAEPGHTVRHHVLSVLVENRLRLGPRLNLDNTLLLYRWRGGRSGIDSDTELSYDLTRSIRLGLRHEWRERAVDLDGGEFKRLSLTTRLAF